MSYHLSPNELTSMAYVVTGSAVLRRVATKEKVPAALLPVLLALHTLAENKLLGPSSADLRAANLMSLPLLRMYVRELEARKFIVRQKLYRRGPRLLVLTIEGRWLARRCVKQLHTAAKAFLEEK